ncbi:hypothetical protein [Streptomyces sp. NRRL F-5126]|uniref:hypothetical protein n=1 Tax=Streptomyces sp. NRRL F-5126 TaxID=1463857 RepID=UPI00068DA4B2|nr:hypothetical protein [Streptomyces sp. NRRL F-5126]
MFLTAATTGTAGVLLAALLAAAPAAPAAHAGPGAPAAFADCPPSSALPAGAELASWRCEVMSATGHLTIGRLDVPISGPITVTHAEGDVGGRPEQVWGGMSAAPIPVGRAPLTLTPRYGGHFDFLSDARRVGELDLSFAVSGPGLPPGCRIGGGTTPVHLVLQPASPGSTTALEDTTFAVPRSRRCGPLGRVLDRAVGLPSAAGQNAIVLHGERSIRYYDASAG